MIINNVALTVDILIFVIVKSTLKILLIKRKNPPEQNKWALPGGFIEVNETLEEAANRELFEETNLKDIPLYQFYTFGNPNRDPRGRVVTVAYYTIINEFNLNPVAGDDAKEVGWFDCNNLPELAFDHDNIIKQGLFSLKRDLSLKLVNHFTQEEQERIFKLLGECNV